MNENGDIDPSKCKLQNAAQHYGFAGLAVIVIIPIAVEKRYHHTSRWAVVEQGVCFIRYAYSG